MAGDWIKVEKATARKPEVLRVADALKIHPDHAFGLCFRFWCWCDDQLENGNAVGVTETLVDALVERSGFASALLSVGWLQVRSGSLVIPNFDRHLAESAKTRALTAKRVSKHKTKKSNGDSVTSALPREEKRREEDKNPPAPLPEGIYENLGDALTFGQKTEWFQKFCDAFPQEKLTGVDGLIVEFETAAIRITSQLKIETTAAYQLMIDRAKLYAASKKGKSEFGWGAKAWLKDGHYNDRVESWNKDESKQTVGKPKDWSL